MTPPFNVILFGLPFSGKTCLLRALQSQPQQFDEYQLTIGMIRERYRPPSNMWILDTGGCSRFGLIINVAAFSRTCTCFVFSICLCPEVEPLITEFTDTPLVSSYVMSDIRDPIATSIRLITHALEHSPINSTVIINLTKQDTLAEDSPVHPVVPNDLLTALQALPRPVSLIATSAVTRRGVERLRRALVMCSQGEAERAMELMDIRCV